MPRDAATHLNTAILPVIPTRSFFLWGFEAIRGGPVQHDSWLDSRLGAVPAGSLPRLHELPGMTTNCKYCLGMEGTEDTVAVRMDPRLRRDLLRRVWFRCCWPAGRLGRTHLRNGRRRGGT